MSDPGTTPAPEPLPAAPTLESSTGAVGAPPKSIRQAVALMYAGAVVALINVVIAAFSKSAIRETLEKQHAALVEAYAKDPTKTKPWDLSKLDSYTSQAWLMSMISGAIFVALWVILAHTNKKGNSIARIIATVLTVLNVLFTVANLLGGFNLATFVYYVVTMALGVGATYLLWRRESSDYYNAVKASRV
ncbi:hypothetical protein [Branchiibius cervicis]|uniref:Uncharacterized protein n=1 Tax=Branchiibius cervicis TaxID=908252 RepID=A0ABW2AQ35_9MICO